MSAVLDAIRQQGVVAIVRTSNQQDAEQTTRTLMSSGLRVLEVSLVTPGALDVIRDAAAVADVNIHIGVGTALTSDDVRSAAEAGAKFVVSPVLDERVLKTALDLGLDTLPGVATPTEALRALEWGSTLVKLFPGSLWSPTALRDVLTALPLLEAVPTGGISVQKAPEWIRAGATALGLGSSLTKADDPQATVEELLAAIRSARS